MEKNKKYTVALISSGLGHIKRGIETWTEDMGKALKELNISFVTYKGGGNPEHSYERVIACMRRDLPSTKWIVKQRPGFMWRLGLSTPYALEEMTFSYNILPELILRQYDIIHTQDAHIADFCRIYKKLKLIKSEIILAHGTEEPFKFLGKFDYIQHLAPYHQEEMKQNGFSVEKHFAIGNFVDINYFQPNFKSNLREELNIPKDAFVVLSVAAIKKTHKRIDYLIEEINKLNNPNVHLIVAGAFERESPSIIELGEKTLGPRVKFLKNFPRTRILEAFKCADIFALCSLKEMMPIALLEALSCGLPCLVHQYPVEEWMIGSGGESLDMSKPSALKTVIEKYMADKNYLQHKSKLAREHILKNFSKEIIMDRVIDMYETILRKI